jgi:hypothetical protein
VAGSDDERDFHDAIAKANPALFQHGRPSAVSRFDGFRRRIEPGVVQRAEYRPRPLDRRMHPDDPRYDTSFSYRLHHNSEEIEEMRFYDALRKRKEEEHMAQQREMQEYEAYIAGLHDKPGGPIRIYIPTTQ